MNPKHKSPSPTQVGRIAHAPYNFVPLPEKVVTAEPLPDQDRYHPDRYTGFIECTMTTESPLYTRTALNPEFFRAWAGNVEKMMKNGQAREEYAQFFHLDDAERPVVPGSSLRGMVRALVEIAGYGKIQWVTDESLVFRAVGDTTSLGQIYRNRMKQSAIQAGYLQGRGSDWQIRPAKLIGDKAIARIHSHNVPKDGLRSWKGCQNAWSIHVQIGKPGKTGVLPLVSSASARPISRSQEAVLVRTGQMQNKNKDFVFGLPDEQVKPMEVSDEMISAYRNQITQGQRSLLGEEGALREMQPVFYLVEDGNLTFFGHTMMFRLPYGRSPLKFIPKSLRRESEIDLAEAIFGYVPDRGRQESRGGRVFFTDARFQSASNGVWLSPTPITPKILSSPKPTTFQHYLTQQDSDNKRSLDHYSSPPPHEAVIRGHKLYWHKGPIGQKILEEGETVDWARDSQHTQIKPVKAGVTFRFRVYFEDLSEVELGALLWVLTLPGEPGKGYRHKIGMGKPLGMGSIYIQPILYLSDRKKRYNHLFEGEVWNTAISQQKDWQPFTCEFERWVFERMDQSERNNAQSFREVKRIEMLLKMLEWRGPDRSLTPYMTIEPTNEYKDRPVLPDPLHVEQSTKIAPPPGKPTALSEDRKRRPK